MRGIVHGNVVRADNGAPVANATIEVVAGPEVLRAPDPTVVTNSAGSFAFRDLPAGEWVLRATSPAGRGQSARVFVYDNAASEVTIELGGAPPVSSQGAMPSAPPNIPERRLRGSVCGYVVRADSRAPVPRATIRVVRGPGTVREPVIETDDDGSFTMTGLLQGYWVFSANSSAGSGEAMVYVFDNAVSDATIEVSGEDVVRPPDSRPEPKARPKRKSEENMRGGVRGRVVRLSTGEPVVDATITIVRGAGPAPDIAPLTDASGRFTWDELPPGDWIFRARGTDGETGVGKVRVSAGSVADFVIEIGEYAAWQGPME